MTPQFEVLVADGDVSVRNLLEVIVRRLPATPVVAEDGRSALELLFSHSFDAVVMDPLLPHVEGSVLLEFMARENPALLQRVVVVTTTPEYLYRSSAHASSIHAVLRKPFALEELRESLLSCCHKSGKA